MTTLAELSAASTGTFDTFTDPVFPAGHFGATAYVGGILRGYLLEGQLDNPEAVIKGHIEYRSEGGKLVKCAFAKGGATGGVPLGAFTDFKEIFTKMV